MAGVFCDGPGGRACFCRRPAMYFASVGCVFCVGGVFCDGNPPEPPTVQNKVYNVSVDDFFENRALF